MKADELVRVCDSFARTLLETSSPARARALIVALREILQDGRPPRRFRRPPEGRSLGPWLLADDGMAFVRLARPSIDLWSGRQSIAVAKHSPRIVLIGESVARSVMLDPHVNTASVLECMLRGILGTEVEVVDLARSGLIISDALDLLQGARLLQPDRISTSSLRATTSLAARAWTTEPARRSSPAAGRGRRSPITP
jgi:hypothetical protein